MTRRLVFIASCAAIILSPHAGAAQVTLPDGIHQRISQLSQGGDSLAERGEYRQAIEKYVAALELLPEPLTQWEASTWLLGAIGDANFLSGNHRQAQAALADAMSCPGGVGNPFLHLRLGQAELELGNKGKAADELARAYMGAGAGIFAGENPKYFAFLKTVLKPPPGGNW